ncbi:MAG TPA: hypothetical protein VK826_20045 [Bacteroidia bacterium]|nr:hypothetical protein [Bacteroidia bacterium]
MKHFFFAGILFTVVSCAVNAQGIQGGSGHTVYTLEVGYTNFRPWKLNDRVVFGNQDGFYQLVTVGLSGSTHTLNQDDDEFDAALAFHLFQPAYKVEAWTDSSSLTVRGWELMTSIFGYDVIKNEHIDLILAPGIFWGNLKLKEQQYSEPDRDMLYKNPFVAPMARVDLRFNFWRISVGGRFSYRYDITKGNWKRRNDGMEPLPGYKFREAQFMVYLGWILTSER